MDLGSVAVHRMIVAVDVEHYASAQRSDLHRLAVRSGMYAVMTRAFDDAGIPWDTCTVSDAGDSLVVLVPPEVPKAHAVDRLPDRLAAMLRRHNETHAESARIRLRVAVHAGEIHHDRNGIAGEAVNFTCRLLDAKPLKAALAASAENLVLIVSEWFFAAVVRHEPAARPDLFRRVDIAVKETETRAHIRTFDTRPAAPEAAPPPPRHSLTMAEVDRLVTALLDVPLLASPEGREQVLDLLPKQMWSSIRRHASARVDVVNIVTACWRYPDGMARLAEAVRFYARDTHPMARVDAVIAELAGTM